MKDKLTAIEAAMLALWMLGAEKVFAYNDAELSASGSKTTDDGKINRVKASMQFAYGKAATIIAQEIGYGKPFDIFPWLQKHGITPPEME